MLETVNLTKRFDGFAAVKNLSFRVETGSIYGLAGYNGAGKTTLLKCMAGIYRPEEGAALLDGANVFDNPVREQLFFVADDLLSPIGMSIHKLAQLYAGYYPNFSFAVFDKLCNAFGLNPKKLLASLSKGMRRQAELIYALASMPKVLLLDEAFDGLDPQKRGLCKELFVRYIAENECTMVISSHILDDLQRLCDRFGLMDGHTLKLDSDSADIGKTYRRYTVTLCDENAQLHCPAVRIKHMHRQGKQLRFEAQGDLAALQSVLQELQSEALREENMTVDEIFLFEMEDESNDLDNIFRP
jgi:ABC-2 type transport system ATP-binding protein